MNIILVGVNHRTAPIALRERLAFRPEQLPMAYTTLRTGLGLSETLILSTCNRVEIYVGAPSNHDAANRVKSFLGSHGGLRETELDGACYAYTELDAVRHLFQVVSGLDSMVLGEAEILHQVKQAYAQAQTYGTTGKVLNVLFQKALNVGKTVRARTALGRGGMSVGSVAIELAQKVFGDLRTYQVLFIGAGTLGELTLKRLVARGVTNICIANRSLERAQALASDYGASACGLDALEDSLVQADLLIASASVADPLITRAHVERLMLTRHRRPLCLIDLGVPRNIEPAAGQVDNVYRFDLDDLQRLMLQRQGKRQHAADEARVILERKADLFLAWRQHQQREHVPWSSVPAGAP